MSARYTALVLAATRGNQDPLALAGGVSHKAFIDIAGTPMLLRVVRALIESGRVGRVVVSIETAAMDETRALLAPLGADAAILYAASRENIGTSVAAAVEAAGEGALPMIITTGDNALHTPDMVAFFCDALDGLKVDGALGLTPASYILEKYPEGNRAFHRFSDGQFSSCNLYAFLTPKAVGASKIFNTGGQFAKRPGRLIAAFGVLAFLLYKSRLAKLGTVLAVLSRGLGVTVAPVFMPFAEGPIDVDRQQDWDLANRIVSAREAA